MSAESKEYRYILFLCTGNYYRSRFAQAVFNHWAQRENMPWRAFSRGLRLVPEINPGKISIHTRGALKKRKIPLRYAGYAPKFLKVCDLKKASIVIALKEAEHLPLMRRHFAIYADAVEYWTIHDLDVATPADALPQIERRVKQIVARLKKAPLVRHPAP